jgi:hypothetical protein
MGTSDVVPGHLSQFRPDPNNARVHPEDNIEAIRASIRETGAGRSILATGDGTIVAGHGVAEAAEAEGITKAIVVETDGDAIIVHKRRDLLAGDPRTTKAALYDNIAPLKARWDPDVLERMRAEDTDVVGIFGGRDAFDRVISKARHQADPDLPDDPSPALAEAFEYRLVVDCADERDQAALLERLEGEGRTCQPLIS